MNKDQEIMDEIDSKLADFKFERGLTPADIKQKCYDLCKDYLSGVWSQASIDDIVVTRVSGGLTNQLFLCELNEDLQSKCPKDVPKEVAIRLYGDKHFNNYDKDVNERLNDTIISLMVSEHNLGPKLFGLFETGQILKFYKHKQFRKDQWKDAKLMDQLAQKLAGVHAMDVPINRSQKWIFESFDNFYSEANKLYDMKALINECNCETFKAHDLYQELQWLKEMLIKTNSPVTFTHVDFRGSNIMVTQEDGIVLCDFEYSCYDYRGFDLGTFYYEWERDNPLDIFKPVVFPDDSVFKPFIESYIRESTKLLGKAFTDDKRNTVDNLLNESKIFALVSQMFFVTMIYKSNEAFDGQPFDKKKSLVFNDLVYKNYHATKQLLIKNNII